MFTTFRIQNYSSPSGSSTRSCPRLPISHLTYSAIRARVYRSRCKSQNPQLRPWHPYQCPITNSSSSLSLDIESNLPSSIESVQQSIQAITSEHKFETTQ